MKAADIAREALAQIEAKEEWFYFNGQTLISVGMHASFDSADRDFTGDTSFYLTSKSEWQKIMDNMAAVLSAP
jgi:hypothetical protein